MPSLPRPVSQASREPAAPFLPHELQEIARREGRGLALETPEGSFPIVLDYENAPVTAEYFYNLAVAAQFDGPPFTVLANAYAQVPAKASAPLLRPEPSPAPFLRGTLGMVRSGRDSDAPVPPRYVP